MVAPAIVPWIALTWGWRAAFVIAGCAGFAWLVLWIPLYDSPEKLRRVSAAERALIAGDADQRAGQRADDAGPPIGWRAILRHRQAWSFIIGKFLTDPVWWFFLIWLPDFFKKTRGLDIKGSRLYLVSIYGIVTVLSVVGGWLPGALTRQGFTPTRARKTTMLMCALAVLPIIAVTRVGTWSAVVLIGIAGSAHQAWSANLFTTVSDMFPGRAVARLVGMGGMAGSIGGIAFPLVAGMLLDRFQAQGQRDRRLRDPVPGLRVGLPGRLRGGPAAGAELRAGVDPGARARLPRCQNMTWKSSTLAPPRADSSRARDQLAAYRELMDRLQSCVCALPPLGANENDPPSNLWDHLRRAAGRRHVARLLLGILYGDHGRIGRNDRHRRHQQHGRVAGLGRDDRHRR